MWDSVKEGEGHQEDGTTQFKYRGCWVTFELWQGRDEGLSFAVTTEECSRHREQTLPASQRPRPRRGSVAGAEWVRVVEVRLRS